MDINFENLPGVPVLLGVGGSHAYGLAHADSDIDYRGCYVVPTIKLFGLEKPAETYDGHDPDLAMHEVGKLLRLAMKGNPTVLESLWYDEYLIEHEVGTLILNNRNLFLSDLIRATHAGYAASQLNRIKTRSTDDEEATKRSKKNARHLFRLIQQGERALTTGVFTIKVKDRDEIFAFGELPYDEMVETCQEALTRLETVPSVLPPEPDFDAINDLLVSIRLLAMDW